MIKKIDKSWTLFLDRDGVINVRLVDEYVTKWDDFKLIKGSLEAISLFSEFFGTIVVITNQAGIGKGLMAESALEEIHNKFLADVEKAGGRIDQIYFCPSPDNKHPDRKPNIGMALRAKADFPHIDFAHSVMVGDSKSDMAVGHQLGMLKVFIEGKHEVPSVFSPDYTYKTLWDFAQSLRDESL